MNLGDCTVQQEKTETFPGHSVLSVFLICSLVLQNKIPIRNENNVSGLHTRKVEHLNIKIFLLKLEKGEKIQA